MSKEVETSDFTSKGTISFPPTHEDNLRTAEISGWPSSVILGKIALYEDFLERPEPQERARKTGARILTHLRFENDYRDLNPDWEATS